MGWRTKSIPGQAFSKKDAWGRPKDGDEIKVEVVAGRGKMSPRYNP